MATTFEVKPETATLNNEEILRYSRHLIMPEVGMEGQHKLKAAQVLCIGAGGLGSPLALVSGGGRRGHAGHRGFRRRRLHATCSGRSFTRTADVGRKKLDSAADKLKADQSRSSMYGSSRRG